MFEDDERKWRRGADPAVRFPTFTRAIPRKAPPKSPAGIKNTPPDAEARWRSCIQVPALHIQGGVHDLGPLEARERERLMGFLLDHTMGLAKKMPESEDEKQALAA